MKVVKSIILAGAALAIAAPAFAGRYNVDVIAQERAVQKQKAQAGVAVPKGAAAESASTGSSKARAGHPTERLVR